MRFWLPVDASSVSVSVDLQVVRAEHLEAAVRRAGVESYQGLAMKVATREDLIVLKLSAWRPIDRADAIELAALAPDTLDWDYLRGQAQASGLSDRLEEVRQVLAAEGLG